MSYSRKLNWYSWLDWVNSKIELLEQDWIKILNWIVGKEFIWEF